MIRLKTLIGLVTAVGLFAILAGPASAEWRSLNGTTHGPSQLKENTVAAFKVSSSSPELKCAKVPDEWKLQKKETSQEPVTTGGHLVITSKWEECKVEVVLMKIPVKVEGCTLEMRQPPGVFTATGVVAATCVVTIETKPACIIEVPPTGNQQLNTIKLVNEGSNQEDIVEVSGITSTIGVTKANKEECEKISVKPGSGTFNATIIEHEINAF